MLITPLTVYKGRAVHCDERTGLRVCPHAYLRNYTSDLRHIFCAYYLWPWLGPLAALRYVMYFRFYGWRHVCT